MATLVSYLQGWDLVHPDDTITNFIPFENRPVGHLNETDLSGHLLIKRTGSNSLVIIAGTGSPTYLIENKTANLFQTTVKAATRIQVCDNAKANRMVCYNGYKTLSFGRDIASIESGEWTITLASFIVVGDRRANILERNIFPLIGVHLHQQKPAGKSVNLTSDDTNFNFTITNWIGATYQGLCTKLSRTKNHMVHTNF